MTDEKTEPRFCALPLQRRVRGNDKRLLSILVDFGCPVIADRLLIAYYKREGVILKRRYVVETLSRLKKKGLVDGKHKAWWATAPNVKVRGCALLARPARM